ncbi:MAG: ATPase V [Spirochaetales bacterium]|nr:ATPase V [Spirochaetales bacterium]
MIFTTRMKHVIAVVLDRDADKVTRELLKAGLLHFVDVKEIRSDWNNKIDTVVPDVSRVRIGEIKKRIENFLTTVNESPPAREKLDISALKPANLDESDKILDKISDKLQGIRDRQQNIQQEILKLEDIRRQVDLFGDVSAGIRAHTKYSFLTIQTGTIPSSRLDDLSAALKEVPSVILHFNEENGRTNLLLITMKRDDSRIDNILDQYGWIDTELKEEMHGVKDDVIHDLETKIAGFEAEQKALREESTEMIRENLGVLKEMWSNLMLNELYFRIQAYFSKTARTVLFSGWLPASKQKAFEEEIRGVTGDRCYMQWSDPVEIERLEKKEPSIPVEMKTPSFLAPFKMIVKNYATPEYGTIDPTPFVAVAYMCMFGLMFADVGQGVIIALFGIFGAIFYRGPHDDVKNLLKLIAWCGGAAIVTGFLFNSYFGMQLFRPLWFDYHGIVMGHDPAKGLIHSIFDILAITIYFGVAVITVGLLINWINLAAKRKWFRLILDKTGIVGGLMYFAGIYVTKFLLEHSFKEAPSPWILFFGMGLPAVLFLLKPPIEFVRHRKHDPSKKFGPFMIFDFFIEWFVEMLEIFSSYLSNTLSFLRVAGFGIAHVSLMGAFIQMAEGAAGGPGNYSVLSIIILVIGNIMVIGLEGLVAGIQSLRLNYYEFFTKYFTGKGTMYSPVSLRSR